MPWMVEGLKDAQAAGRWAGRGTARLDFVAVIGWSRTIQPTSATMATPIQAPRGTAYPDEDGPPANLPQPEILSRNGSFMAYRCLQEHVGRFRDFLRQHGRTREEQELIAAKLMGRWRSGAPLTLAPEKDDPALGADLQRNNDFN